MDVKNIYSSNQTERKINDLVLPLLWSLYLYFQINLVFSLKVLTYEIEN